jgi:hypothetical protein
VRSVLLDRIRLALVAGLALVNAFAFMSTRVKANESCAECYLVPGGAVGYHSECFFNVEGGRMGSCTPYGITTCWGNRCGGFGDEEEFDNDGESPF